MLKEFITQPDGSVSLEDYVTALDEIRRLRKRVEELEAAQQERPADVDAIDTLLQDMMEIIREWLVGDDENPCILEQALRSRLLAQTKVQ